MDKAWPLGSVPLLRPFLEDVVVVVVVSDATFVPPPPLVRVLTLDSPLAGVEDRDRRFRPGKKRQSSTISKRYGVSNIP